MLFNSLEFLIFLPVVFILYWFVFKPLRCLDYSHWGATDDERLDAHHLNYKGAVRFTEELKKRFGFE